MARISPCLVWIFLCTARSFLQAQAPVDYLSSIKSEAEFDSVAIPSARPGEVKRTTKFLLPAAADAGLLSPLFQNANKYQFHFEFLKEVFPVKFPAFTIEQYLNLIERRSTRKYFAGTLARYEAAIGTFYGFAVITQTQDSELLTLQETKSVFAALQGIFAPTPLYYAPDAQPAKLLAREWRDPGFPIYLGSGTEAKYQGYTLSTGFGRVRLLTLAAFEAANQSGKITWQDILVLERAPSDIEGVVAGVITGEQQGELSHLSIRTARRNTPNAYLQGALDVLRPLEGKLIRLEVGATAYSAVEAKLEDAEKWWLEHRPKLSEAPKLDPEYAKLDPVVEMNLSPLPVPPEARFGGKATNFARLQRILTAPHEKYKAPAFAVPVRYYLEFIRTNMTESLLRPGVRLTYEQCLKELLASSEFKSDSTVRFEKLQKIRGVMEDDGVVDPMLVSNLGGRIEELFGSRQVPVRFRSSSNVEDALEFNGAGLYSSTTACAADDLDFDDDGPSLCDPSQPNERRIARALKRVWSSLWTFRALEERDYYGIPQDLCAMGVLVSKAFLDEKANGVAFTGNPTNARDRRYIVTAQKGEESVVSPEPGKLPEKDVLEIDKGVVTRIDRVQRSTLVPAGENVVSDETLKELGALLALIDRDLPVDLAGHERSEVLFDVEFKVDKGGQLALKQVRPFLVTDSSPRGPVFELDVPANTIACGAFLDGREPRLEYENKSQLRFVTGKHQLPSDVPSFSGRLFEEVLFGPAKVKLTSLRPGRFRVETQSDGRGNVSYQYEYEEIFSFPDGKEVSLELSFLTFEVRQGQPPVLTKTVDEEYLTDQLVLYAVSGGDRLIRYSSCIYEGIPLWHGRADLEGGDTVLFEERFHLPLAGSGPANIMFAEVSIGGARREVRDYWSLAYAAQHHNVHVKYWIVLEPPLSLGNGKDVHVIEVFEPEYDTGVPAKAAYLDAAFRPIARPVVGCWKKALSTNPLGVCGFRRGDTNSSGTVNLTDAIYLLQHLFTGGLPLSCADTGDFDDDGIMDLTDAVLILTFLFRGADLSGPPGPYDCGTDPIEDTLADCIDGGCGGG